jgi:hypothetical protein
MNENLAKYISSALRNTTIDQAIYKSIESKLTVHHPSNDFHKPQFIVDTRFSLRLEEVA